MQRFLMLSFQPVLGNARSTSEVEGEFRFILFLTIMFRLLAKVVEFMKEVLVSCTGLKELFIALSI